jgi:protein MpaA
VRSTTDTPLVRNYDPVVARVDAAGHPTECLGEVAGMPVLTARVGSGEATILLIAGTHGDEPATVEAALQTLEQDDTAWTQGLTVDVLPCTNPTGFVRHTRETHVSGGAGADVNWSFDRDDVPEVNLLRDWLRGRRYDAVVDFHEDWETPGFYLYEHRHGVPAAGPAMIAAVEPVCAINRDAEIEGWPSREGVVTADSSRERLARGDGFPLVLLRDHTPHKLTTETPTELPMHTRVQAHRAALAALLRHYSTPQPAAPGRDG